MSKPTRNQMDLLYVLTLGLSFRLFYKGSKIQRKCGDGVIQQTTFDIFRANKWIRLYSECYEEKGPLLSVCVESRYAISQHGRKIYKKYSTTP